ncbi:MAG: hypothetical protein WBY44_22615 [Bryobacteraceae bacterium]
MIGRALLLCVSIAWLCPAAANDDRVVEIALANALHSGDSQAALKLFNPKMAGYAGLRADIGHLLETAEVALSVDTETHVWTLEITSRDLASGVTRRKAKVSIRTEGGIVQSLQPAAFFAPPSGREAWDAVFAFATTLQNEEAQPQMEEFDRTMPGYADLKNAITALWTRYQIEPSLDLKSNEGDDTHRTLQIDWVLTLQNQQDPVHSTRREQSAVCVVEKRGKAWKIVSFSPASLFIVPLK